jgi:hypothetical protein
VTALAVAAKIAAQSYEANLRKIEAHQLHSTESRQMKGGAASVLSALAPPPMLSKAAPSYLHFALQKTKEQQQHMVKRNLIFESQLEALIQSVIHGCDFVKAAGPSNNSMVKSLDQLRDGNHVSWHQCKAIKRELGL